MTPPAPPLDSFVIPTWAQGQTGIGQGGWTSARFEASVGRALTVSLRSPAPLETELSVVEVGHDHWQVGLDEAGEWRVVSEGRPAPRQFATTEPVSIEGAADARSRYRSADHPAPLCFSCGTHPESMCVHSGPLLDGTGRYATDWTPPSWVGDADGVVDAPTIWAVLDCSSGFYVGQDPDRSGAVTVQYEVEILDDVRVEASYAVVSWNGLHPDDWDGRKRGAGSCIFDADGTLVAHSTSFWVAPAS
ncbi:MAG: hypothetical protein R2733_18185 [Acidimicrobiales bacterium]